MNIQMQYHLKLSKQELSEMDDYTWAETYAMLADIRKKEAKNSPLQLK